MRKVNFAAGEIILREGEEGDTAFLITAGAVEMLIGEGAQARTVAKLTTGDVFGEISLIEPGPRSATVRASEDTLCAMTSFDEFMGWIEEDPAQAVMFMRALVPRLRQMNQMQVSLDPEKRSLQQRLADWFRSLDPSAEKYSADERKRLLTETQYVSPLV